MMTREQMDEMVVDYLYDELSPSALRSFEEALPSFPELSEEVKAGLGLRAMLKDVSSEPAPVEVTQRIMGEARAHLQATERPSFFGKLTSLIMQPAFATAMVFVVVGTTTVLLSSRDSAVQDRGEERVSVPSESRQTGESTSASFAEASSEMRVAAATPAPPVVKAKGRASEGVSGAPTLVAGASTATKEKARTPTRVARAERVFDRAAKATKRASKDPKDTGLRRLKAKIALAGKRSDLFSAPPSSNAESADAGFGASPRVDLAQRTRAEPVERSVSFDEDESADVARATRAPDSEAREQGLKKEKSKKGRLLTEADRRLLQRFSKAIKRRQLDEARKLLRLMSKRPALAKNLRLYSSQLELSKKAVSKD